MRLSVAPQSQAEFAFRRSHVQSDLTLSGSSNEQNTLANIQNAV